MKKVAIGVDIGGTNTAIGVVDELGNVIVKDNILTRTDGDVDLYVDDLTLAIRELIKSVKLINTDIEVMGIGIDPFEEEIIGLLLLSEVRIGVEEIDVLAVGCRE